MWLLFLNPWSKIFSLNVSSRNSPSLFSPLPIIPSISPSQSHCFLYFCEILVVWQIFYVLHVLICAILGNLTVLFKKLEHLQMEIRYCSKLFIYHIVLILMLLNCSFARQNIIKLGLETPACAQPMTRRTVGLITLVHMISLSITEFHLKEKRPKIHP